MRQYLARLDGGGKAVVQVIVRRRKRSTAPVKWLQVRRFNRSSEQG